MYPKTRDLIEQYLHDGVFPGASYAFIKDGQCEKHIVGKSRTYPADRTLTSGMCYDVASLTKVICTNSVVLQLIEVGAVDIDQPLQHYLPEYQDGRVSLRHLLTHTSDINGYIPNRNQLSREELTRAFYSLPAGERLGRRVVYTDTGTILIGFMLEKLLHQDLHTIFKERVLGPLGMTGSSLGTADTKRAVPTENHPERGLIHGQVHDTKAYILGRHCGSAGLFATLADVIRFAEMMLKGGELPDGRRYLAQQTISSLFSDWTPSGTLGRSLGWDLLYDKQTNQPLIYHTGYTGTFLIIDQTLSEAFIFLSNRVHPTDNKEAYLIQRDRLVANYLSEKSKLHS
ncbi:serine hydrolase domain-containing protein [Vagococcus acidifermentans]|uniref:Beta-lactamase-related domain-containing protein n=1 Tax=Vagococcus acidifermentans TaxID=564710 RepID=A0A430B0Q9_9ENTE|nr:serine hydrolase domain-containing protein [Vagococcus acidifermentans]RSU13831.1 hypothetical protein CBF27_02720 [Vagococcus acidifermentans]